jgi:hypothetical protein
MNRLLVLVLLVLPGGCGVSQNLAATMAVGANVGSVAAIGRTPADAVYSWWTGRDCSLARLDAGETYCRPVEPPPPAPVFCTRSLARVDCWADADAMKAQGYHGVADGRTVLTPAQEANRVQTWP